MGARIIIFFFYDCLGIAQTKECVNLAKNKNSPDLAELFFGQFLVNVSGIQNEKILGCREFD